MSSSGSPLRSEAGRTMHEGCGEQCIITNGQPSSILPAPSTTKSSTDRMPFQLMMNETAFVEFAHPLLGAHWDWSGEETCMKMIMLCNVMLCGPAERYRHIGACCLHLIP